MFVFSILDWHQLAMEAHAGAFKRTSILASVASQFQSNTWYTEMIHSLLSSLDRHLMIDVKKILISVLFQKIPTSSILPFLSFSQDEEFLEQEAHFLNRLQKSRDTSKRKLNGSLNSTVYLKWSRESSIVSPVQQTDSSQYASYSPLKKLNELYSRILRYFSLLYL